MSAGRRARTLTKRRKVLKFGTVLLVLALLAAACGDDDDATPTTAAPTTAAPTETAAPTTAAPTAPEIPQATVNLAYYPCCADLAVPVVAIREGFFEDVGITIAPEGGFVFPNFESMLPAMQRGDHDMTIYPDVGVLSTLNTFGQDLPPIMQFDTYVGYSILVPPDSPVKTTEELVAEGVPFAEAAAMAVEQVRGKEITISTNAITQPPYPEILLSYGGLTYDDVTLTHLDDPSVVAAAAVPGRVEFAVPYNGPNVVQLVNSGWRPLIDVFIVLENDPEGEQSKRLADFVSDIAVIAQRDFVEENYETTLRVLSVFFRVIDHIEDPATRGNALQQIADEINSTHGLSLSAEDVGFIFDRIDPLWGWDDHPSLWEDPESIYFVPRHIRTSLDALIENGTLPDQEYDVDNFLLGDDFFQDLKELRAEADALFAEAKGLTGPAADLVEQARTFYSWHDYLDAVAYLNAALGKG